MSYMRGSRSGGFKVKIELPQAFRRTDIHPHSLIVFANDLSLSYCLGNRGASFAVEPGAISTKNLGR